MSDADLQLKTYNGDMQVLIKEKMAAMNFLVNTKKQYDWILDKSKYILLSLCSLFY